MKKKPAKDLNLLASSSRRAMRRASGGLSPRDGRRFVFLSYAHADGAAAEALVETLAASAIDVWWDRRLEPGADFDEVIEAALEQSAAVIVIWSDASVTSRYVRTEAGAALELDKVVPVHVEGFDPRRMPLKFRNLHSCCVTDDARIVAALAGRGL